jgi:shikimate 5-dehydrogenase
VFDAWAAALDQPWTLRGVDLPPDTAPQTYRHLLAAMRNNPRVRGAVITAHKLRLYRACAAELTSSDRLVDLTREINTLVVDGGRVAGYANDARSLTAILDPYAGQRIVCLGAGGAATALLLALHTDIDTGAPRHDPPSLVFADIDGDALTELQAVADRVGARPTMVHLTGPADEIVAGAALVVNATGLGKDRPGSPLTDRAPLGPGVVAWDLNYRGDLTFLRQAAARGASTMDGWDYFVAGWAGGLTAIAGVPFDRHVQSALATVAAPHRPTGASR